MQARSGAPGLDRTADTRFRKPVLYPVSGRGAGRFYHRPAPRPETGMRRWPRRLVPRLRSCPQSTDREREKPIVERKGTRSGVQNETGDEAVAELVAQPTQVARTVPCGCRLGFHLDADDPTVCGLQNNVHLMPALLLSKVIRAELGSADRDLCTKLRHHEGVENPPEQVPVAHDTVDIDAQSSTHQARVDHVAFGRAGQALQSIGRPRRDGLHDEQVRQKSIVGRRRLGVDPRGIVELLVFHDSRRTRGQRLKVTPQPYGVAVAGDLCSVTRQDLVEVSVQPAPPGWALQMQGWAWKRSGERHLDVALQVRGVGRDPSSRFDTLGHDPLEESGLTNVADDFTHDQTGHGDSHQPARSRPRVGLDVGADRARQQESAGPRVVVHRPLERAADRRYDLPLIQKDRLLEAMKSNVRISAKGGRVGVAGKPDDRASESQSRGGLADSTRTDDQHSGKLAKELGYESVDIHAARHEGPRAAADSTTAPAPRPRMRQGPGRLGAPALAGDFKKTRVRGPPVCYLLLPILNILVPQSGQMPWVAGLPFFIVTACSSFMVFLARHFTQ